jgi:hypothetical protein
VLSAAGAPDPTRKPMSGTVHSRGMAAARHKLLDDILALSAEERLALASEILASVEGPVDEDWDAAWLEECERRSRAAAERQEPASTWAEARDRILARLQTS